MTRISASTIGESAWLLIEPRLDELIAESGGRLPAVRMTVSPRRAAHVADDIDYLLSRGFRMISSPAVPLLWAISTAMATTT